MVEATESMLCLHATDPATVYLSAWARTEGMEVADLERALYQERTLVKHLAMRRTLFVFPREVLSYAQAGASERVAGQERRRLVKQVEQAGLSPDGEAWLEEAGEAVLGALAGEREATSTELRNDLEILEGTVRVGRGKWGGEVPIGPRVLNVLHAEGRIVRASNDGAWTASRPRWARAGSWLGAEIAPRTVEEGLGALIKGWLRSFGPGTEADIKWWLGGTLTAVRQTLASLDIVEVELDGETGYLLADDLDPPEPTEPWAALLPGLDPTPMGWFQRDWYIGAHADEVTDSNGNIGATAWCDGRIVGGWRQPPGSAEVELQLLEDVGAEADRELEAEAARLSEWLDGTRIAPRFPSPLNKR